MSERSFIEKYTEEHENQVLARPGWFTLLYNDKKQSDIEGYNNLINSLKSQGYIIKTLSFVGKMSVPDCHKKLHSFLKSNSRKQNDVNHVVIIEPLEKLVHKWASHELLTVIYSLRMQAQIYGTHIIAQYDTKLGSSSFISECIRENADFDSTKMASCVYGISVL